MTPKEAHDAWYEQAGGAGGFGDRTVRCPLCLRIWGYHWFDKCWGPGAPMIYEWPTPEYTAALMALTLRNAPFEETEQTLRLYRQKESSCEPPS